MLRIGIVGAENSHSAAIAKTINVDKAVHDVAVVSIWGETDEFAAKAAQAGQIPTIVKDPKEMIGKVDAVAVDHRHAKFHIPAMEPFLAARLPMFIDKPLCYRLAEGKDFLARCKKAGVPVTSFSTIALQAHFQQFKQDVAKAGKISAASTAGPADVHSQWGGIFFYGIHQVDPLVELFGTDVAAARLTEFDPKHAVCELYWKSGITASLHCVEGWDTGFQFAVTANAGPMGIKLNNDADPYLAGIRIFTKMFQTSVEPFSHSRILAPVAVLEALEKSQASGKIETVEAV